ncbi:hypothetical protein E2C01_096239 [Portunus trituberculatus]|uniref:Uncharacterized protein n=1 Tax=Portunus trituberculatus TaxID=210409 RepID=A0A5B7K294_PORTR|nr:hypothetical protein [Portunus trituberculatus]
MKQHAASLKDDVDDPEGKRRLLVWYVYCSKGVTQSAQVSVPEILLDTDVSIVCATPETHELSLRGTAAPTLHCCTVTAASWITTKAAGLASLKFFSFFNLTQLLALYVYL